MEDKNKDPDLGVVIRSFKEEFKVVFKPFVWIIQTTKQYKLLILICGLLGAAAGLFLNLSQKPFYKATVCFSHQRISDEYCGEMIKGISELVGKNVNNAFLAKKLSVSESVIQNLKSIRYETLNQNLAKFYKDSTDVKLPFKIEVETFDISTLDTLQAGLLNYFESNDYASRLKEIDVLLLKQKEARIKDELKEIDSLKLVVSKSIIPRSTGTGIILGEPVNPMSLYNSSNFLSDKHADIRKKELLNNSFYVVVAFAENAKPAGLGKLSFLVIGFLFGWILGLIVAAFRT
jgi:hypothetical protein